MVESGVKVVACVNHDRNAIESHKANHPDCLHLTEDVCDYKVIVVLRHLVENLRRDFPGCIISIWASLECTNYSKAKGGLPRDGDSRTLAYTLYNYADELNPDRIFIENVREFMAWGPLDENGRPVSRLNGESYQEWISTLKRMGFDYDYKLLDSANFGAYTSRERYFGIFSKGYPIVWPQATHAKKPDVKGMFGKLEKWKAVKDVLDLNDEGRSIFERDIPLVEKTLERIYAGLVKFVADGEKNFMMKYYSGRPKGKVTSLNSPSGTITTGAGPAIIQSKFLAAYYSGGGQIHSIDLPCPTVSTADRFAKVDAQFLTNYYSGGGEHSSIDKPSPVITSVPKQRLTSVNFIDQQYGQSKPTSPNQPAGAITKNPKLNLVTAEAFIINKNSSTAPAKDINGPSPAITARTHNIVKVDKWLMNTNFSNTGSSLENPAPVITANRKHHYLLNPQFDDKGRSLDDPCFTLIARMDKKPPYLVEVEKGRIAIVVYETDSPAMVKIKEFMAIYGIVDIKMRMLRIDELLKIQGFPENYILKGTKTEQKKYIGNAVVPIIAKKIIEVNHKIIIEQKVA